MTLTFSARASVLICASLLAGCSARGSAPMATPGPVAATTGSDCEASCQTEGVAVRQPVLRLTEHGDWGSTQGSGVPSFTLYADGLAVFALGSGADAKAMQTRVSAEEVDAMVEMANERIGELPERIRAANSTDQAQAAIGVVHGGRIYSVSVYGFNSDGVSEPSADPIPNGFLELHRTLKAFAAADAEPWTPDELVVSLYRRDERNGDAQSWPAVLPLPPADAREPKPRVIGRSDKTIQQAIRYRVSGELEKELERVLPDPKSLQTVEWRGTAWLVRTERVVPQRTYFW